MRVIVFRCSFCGRENWARPEDRNAETVCAFCHMVQNVPIRPMPRWMAFLYRLKRCLAR
jgi:transcription initiation factor TFIIIB Brf1 subunit/transcription initiation factor TFIIB